MERRNITDSPMEIYIHIPFCIKKCDYCDFLSGPSGPKEQADYVDALLEEINAAEEGKGRSVSSVFIGGGTPSVLDERFIGEILNHIRRNFQIGDHAEITIEVNPGTADRNKLQAYRTYGINRLSIGLQSPDDRELKILGRIHNYEQFLETYRSAREAGFDNINIDLMSAIPDQTYEGWIHNLRTVAGLDPEHISAYSLIIEEGTPFASRTLKLPSTICMRQQPRFWENMALGSMRFPITQRKAENAGITWAIGSDRIIWGLAWELPLFMERNVLPIHRI